MASRVGNFFFGQSISLSIACTSIFTQYLANRSVFLSFTQSCGTYILLISFLLIRFSKSKSKLHTAWWKYIIVSIIDATANCLIVKAYEYTTILSVMLCDAMCIPSTVVISLLFLHTKFGWRHYVGVFLCLLGLAIMLTSDFLGGDSGTHRITGDIMALCGSVLYAVSNVCQEVLVKHDDWREFLGMVGLGGSVYSLVLIAVFERGTLAAIHWDGATVGLLLGYVLCLFAMYVLTAVFLQTNDAVVFNMHLLTSDVIASILTFFIFDDPPTLLYFVALAITIVGVIIYNLQMPSSDLTKPIMDVKTAEKEKPSSKV